MSDYEENKLSWWFLFLAMIVLALMVPLSFLSKELAVPLITVFFSLMAFSLALRINWSRIF